jgi:hypothetical protein
MAKARYHYHIMLRPEPEGGYMANLRKPNDAVPTDDNPLDASLNLRYSR